MKKKSISTWYQRNRLKINAYLMYSGACLKNITEVREKANIFDYARLGLAFKENWESIFNINNPFCYFNRGWKVFSKSVFNSVLLDLISSEPFATLPLPICAASASGSLAISSRIQDVNFGWIYDPSSSEIDEIFVQPDTGDPKAVIRDIFWKKYCNLATLEKISGEYDHQLKMYGDETEHHYVISPVLTELCQDIQDFTQAGYRRSILFYGPPGTGKTNLTRGIVAELGLKTLRINNLPEFRSAELIEAIELFAPEAIILDDLDSMRMEELSQTLSILEKLNCQIKLVLGTANYVHDLADNLVRPGRFDKAMEVKTLDETVIQRLVEGDVELSRLVMEWPASFIVELMKRVKVQGKKKALAGLSDLEERLRNLKQSEGEYTLSGEHINN